MVELPADIRQALARSRVRSEPNADDQARVASALALRLGIPNADWTRPPPSAAKAAVPHMTWAAKLLAGAGALGLAATLLVALPALRKTDDRARTTPLRTAPTAEVDVTRVDASNQIGVERGPDEREPRHITTRSSRPAHDTRRVTQTSTSQSAAVPHAPARGAPREVQPPQGPPPSAAAAASARSASGPASQAHAASVGAPRERTGTPAATPPPSAANASRHASLERELALVRGASHALDRDEPQAALQLLNQHAREFADGSLAGEREALRLSTLCRLGRDAEARALRGKLAAELARSPLRARIEHDCARD